ncbi:(2Fe-2S)-binding protein [Marinobacterium jannaschii]|uniref:(2Fe-2S)-binding protein n=1 Tax=Marinobacterium jannaschii TaxID=64970 RepID=UPI000685B0A4|nr:(2Fe-2S)-binding protein [Marinobacterium jannaschii]
MFRSLQQPDKPQVRLEINGQPVRVPEGSSVWAAMAQAGETMTRLSPVTEQPRSAYCAMGVCFECLVEIDGQPNQQACLRQAEEGMQVKRQTITESSQAALTPPLSAPASAKVQHYG